ncbi:MAG: adenylate/guanylate cyclase domain-containing protein [Treponema sp.]|nr:adenylate/guanylate cyclase domain-containing protein [Treponema sp.]
MIAGAVFALFYAAGILEPLEDRIYDFFLRGRPERERIDNVVFLDVDDEAIAYNGLFPWPRSVMADGFLRLKEYGTSAVVLDIEFIDKGPEGVDSLYFNRDFPADFQSAFDDVGANVSELLGALRSGRIGVNEAEQYEKELLEHIQDQGANLFQKAMAITRDNDMYLAQASALYGRTWATLNLQREALSGEQAERRALAEQRFSYPIDAAPGAVEGESVDILPPFPAFMEAAWGAGFTNVNIDKDGVRRRIFLAQKVGDYWYLQLAFAPLMEYLGNPAILLEKRRLTLKGARFPASDPEAGGPARDILIPLDAGGRMMLDWPKTDYKDSFTHLSFAEFSHLEELESQMEEYLAVLENTGLSFFAQFDESLSPASGLIYRINALMDQTREARALALEENSGEAFAAYLRLRSEGTSQIESLLALDMDAKLRNLAEGLGEEYPEDAELIREEAEYIAAMAGYLETVLERYHAAQNRLREILEGKFCIIGRVDTGTTDIGVNPFYEEYVNVGTHAVVLDTILNEAFIRPSLPLWNAVLCVVLPVLLILGLGGLKSSLRTGLGVGGVVLFGALCFLVFRYTGVFIGPLGPVLSAFIAVIVRELVSYMVSEKEKQFINKAFSTYVSREVVEELVANPSLLQLGGSSRQMSAIFTDIQNFSTISEQLDPEHLVRLLNRYLTVISDIIMENMGTIDKYEGDAVVAFFGAPVYRQNHAALACRSAVQIKRVEAELNRELIEQGLITGRVLKALEDKGFRIGTDTPVPLYTRIGVNTGEMVVGNMGTSNKMNYTIMGNAVNLAARLESVNKQFYTGGILISEYTKNETGDEFTCRDLGRIRVVGINTPVRIYVILALSKEAGPGGQDILAAWEEALGFYEKREFRKAGEIFGSIAAHDERDNTARLYAEMCRNYTAAPPPDDWDGVNNLSEK